MDVRISAGALRVAHKPIVNDEQKSEIHTTALRVKGESDAKKLESLDGQLDEIKKLIEKKGDDK